MFACCHVPLTMLQVKKECADVLVLNFPSISHRPGWAGSHLNLSSPHTGLHLTAHLWCDFVDIVGDVLSSGQTTPGCAANGLNTRMKGEEALL